MRFKRGLCGKYLIFVIATAWLAACSGERFTLSCHYASTQKALQSYPHCAARRDDGLVIAPKHLKHMLRADNGLAAVFADGAWRYVKASGENLAVLTYDNGPDYFEEGLTRAMVNDKIAYYDTNLNLVLPATYDWAFPFREGRALVCSGCQRGTPDGQGHASMIGGVWGYIDRHGQEVVPVKYRRDALPSP